MHGGIVHERQGRDLLACGFIGEGVVDRGLLAVLQTGRIDADADLVVADGRRVVADGGRGARGEQEQRHQGGRRQTPDTPGQAGRRNGGRIREAA